jgi:hypothetical protein
MFIQHAHPVLAIVWKLCHRLYRQIAISITFTAVCSAQLPDKCAVRLLKDVAITKRQTLSKFECEAGHPWNLALFETDYAMLLGPKIKNIP